METILDKCKRDVLLEMENKNTIVEELIVEKNGLIDNLQKKHKTQENTIKLLNTQVVELQDECKNYENVSIHKNLAKQISEKDNEIRILHNKLSTFEKKYNLLNQKYNSIILINNDKIKIKKKVDKKAQEVKVDDQEEEVAQEEEVDDQEEEEDDQEEEVDQEEVVDDQEEEVEDDQEEEVDQEEVVDDQEEEVDQEEKVDDQEEEEVDQEEKVDDQEEKVDDQEEEEEDQEEEEEDQEEEEEDCEVIEVEFFEKKLKPKNGKGRLLFLITDDIQKDIYERLEDGEPGEHIGRLVGKNNRPYFF